MSEIIHVSAATLEPSAEQRREPWALLSYGFRPFFLAAALWAAIAVGLWIAMLTMGLRLPSRFDPLDWHIHEMLFGFVPAAVAGFLLTAIASWTARRPVSGALLGVLAALWLVGRLAALIGAFVPAGVAIGMDLAFPAALLAVVARELLSARNVRNYVLLAPVAVIGMAQLLLDLGVEGGFGALAGYGWRLGLVAILILVSVIGGRIVPNFTRNWLLQRGEQRLPPAANRIDRTALALLHTALMAWVFWPSVALVGVALLAAAALNLWRLGRWRGAATRDEPLLLVLHVGYAWLVLGVTVLGVTILDGAFPLGAAIHLLTAGAMGTLILAVMTRVSRGHTGRSLHADRATRLIYVLVSLAAAARVAAALLVRAHEVLLIAAAGLWISAFGGFVVRYAPLLLRPRRDR